MAAAPEHFHAGCTIASTGLIFTFLHHHLNRRQLRIHTVLSAKRVLYTLITNLAPALGLVNFLAVTSPPMSSVCGLAQHIVVAVVMASFMELLLLLCYRTSLSLDGSSDKNVPPISNVLQQLEASYASFSWSGGFESSRYIDGIISVVAQQPEMAFWASPPIVRSQRNAHPCTSPLWALCLGPVRCQGCCFALCPRLPCGQRQRASARLIALLRRAVYAYALGSVVGPIAELWVEGAPGMGSYRPLVRRAVGLVELVVTAFALCTAMARTEAHAAVGPAAYTRGFVSCLLKTASLSHIASAKFHFIHTTLRSNSPLSSCSSSVRLSSGTHSSMPSARLRVRGGTMCAPWPRRRCSRCSSGVPSQSASCRLGLARRLTRTTRRLGWSRRTGKCDTSEHVQHAVRQHASDTLGSCKTPISPKPAIWPKAVRRAWRISNAEAVRCLLLRFTLSDESGHTQHILRLNSA